MRLPRILPFKKASPNGGPAKSEAGDQLLLAREQVMAQARARREATTEPVAPVSLDEPPTLPEVVPDPLEALTEVGRIHDPSVETPPAATALEPGAQSAADPAKEQAMTSPLDALVGLSIESNDALGDDLLDLFRDAKEEAQEGSLASEVEDIPIAELLGDVTDIGRRLGLTIVAGAPREPEPEAEAAATVERSDAVVVRVDAAPADASLPPGAVSDTGQATAAATAEPGPTPPDAGPLEYTADSEISDSPRTQPSPEAANEPPQQSIGTPAADAPLPPTPGTDEEPDLAPVVVRTVRNEEEVPDIEKPTVIRTAAELRSDDAGSDQPRRPSVQRYLLHVLFFGLSLMLAAGLGVRSAGGGEGPTAEAYGVDSQQAVLGYLHSPAVLETVVSETPAPTPSAAPVFAFIAPTPTPSAAPMRFGVRAPAFFSYTIKSGDSLMSISKEFDVCPDHILWNNPDYGIDDRLLVGRRLLLPGVAGIIHEVEPGETVEGIAATYSADPDDIVAYPGNHLSSADELDDDMRILIPGGVPASAFIQELSGYKAMHVPSSTGYVWPFYGPITSGFGEERPGYIHGAIDVGGLGYYGAPVLAAASGVVDTVSYDDRDFGRYVRITHGDGSQTIYAHLSEIYVSEGQKVLTSERVGGLGCAGASTGTHLHFEMWINGSPVDPVAYLP